MSTCEVLPTAKMTDDHFMNPCILIRTDATEAPRRGRRRGHWRPKAKTMPSLVCCVRASAEQLSLPLLCLYLALSLSLSLSPLALLSLDNDESAFCKCKIYFAMYKLNVRHINNFVPRWACANASTMHTHTHTYSQTLPGTHTHTHTQRQLAIAIKLRPSSLLCITF